MFLASILATRHVNDGNPSFDFAQDRPERWITRSSPFISSVLEEQKVLQNSEPWFVYILRCSDNSFYTGISIDVEARVKKHNLGLGAVFTAGRRPVTLIYREEHPDQSSAMRREREIKSWGRRKKEKLILRFLRHRSG